jgi:F0F1-type ATP synthase assembly protein I
VAGIGFGLSVVLALGVGALLDAFGVVHDPLFAAVVLLVGFAIAVAVLGLALSRRSGSSIATATAPIRSSIRSSTRSVMASWSRSAS